MKTTIYPDRKGSKVARRASDWSTVLGALCLLAAGYSFMFGDSSAYVPALVIGAVSLFLLSSLFRVLSCIAYDLETIAATKAVDYAEDGDDAD